MAAIHAEIGAGRLRRVDPADVGSNKYSAAIPAGWDLKKIRNMLGSTQLRDIRRHQMNVFALV